MWLVTVRGCENFCARSILVMCEVAPDGTAKLLEKGCLVAGGLLCAVIADKATALIALHNHQWK